MTALGAREGYRLWAPSYSDETAISWIEDDAVAMLTPPLAGLRLLDAGCGTGRRLIAAGAGSATGVDLTPEMLGIAANDAGTSSGTQWLVGDIRALPVPDRAFDVIWCRLAIGHVPDCAAVYAELARAADAGADVIVSDFHPAAYAAGHRRTFRHGGTVHELEHYVHELADHSTAARAAGLTLAVQREARIGAEVRSFYERAGRPALYDEHCGLPVVLVLHFRKAA
jgi:ubiquinone/menaquinone biosynthesis C-methylase UbiE